jgi:hypothetical protein
MSFEEWLQANGFGDGAALSDVQRKALQAAWKSDMARDPDPPAGGEVPVRASGGNGHGEPLTDPDRERQQFYDTQRRERERRTRITQLNCSAVRDCPDLLDELERLAATAIEDGWSVDRYQLEELRAVRPRPSVVVASRGGRGELPDAAVIEAAVCRAGNLEGREGAYRPEVLEAADRYWPHGLGLQELLLTFARRSGYSGLSLRGNERSILKAAFDGQIQATGWGPSTSPNLSGILANVANKFVRVAFEGIDTVWQKVAATRSVNDFKQITTYSLTGDFTYQKLPPGGQIKHGQLGAVSYTNQVDTYARMLGLDRRDLINDDLGALATVGRRLGRGGALALNLAFWTEFLNNSTFFTAGTNSLLTGAGSALSLAALDAAYSAFVRQTDPDGLPLGIQPATLLVPTALYATARQLMNSELLVSGATTAAGNTNVWRGMFEVVSSPYMQNASLTGNSATAWYLLANPNDLPVIEVAFLNGAQQPTVDTMEADFAMLGISMRAYFDFGPKRQEYRGGVKSAGA